MDVNFAVGDILPDYNTTNLDRNPSTLSAEMGENGLLLFVLKGTWCPFCVHQLVATRARYNKYRGYGFNVNFIIPEDEYKVGTFVETASRPFPFGLHADVDETISNSLVGAPAPSRKIGIYLLNRDREIMWQFIGMEDDYPSTTLILREMSPVSSNLNHTA